MKKLQHGAFLTILAILSMALMVGCSGGGASTEAETKEEMKKIDEGLANLPELPEDAKQGPMNPKNTKGAGPGAGG